MNITRQKILTEKKFKIMNENYTNDSKIPTNEPSVKPIQLHKRASNKSPLQLLGNRTTFTKIKIKYCKNLFKSSLEHYFIILNTF